ncbi:MAG: MFS transporter [Chloroflexota bacterium]|nr:MFS transporter [Chloroflexota bacterium]MDE3193500.1 MFS transporter [Chloroflexota bacterium]
MADARTGGSPRDFWTFWTGQTISQFGSSITQFALPLLVFDLTGSALDLGLSFALGVLPYPLFGLAIGAWTDRVDRKRLMIATDIARGLVVGSIPLAALAGTLTVTWVYAVLFVSTTLTIAFNSAQFAVIPALVGKDDLVTANGRIQASFSAASVIGPLVAGALLAAIALPLLILLDAASFIASAISIALIRRELHVPRERTTSIREDIVEGLRYVVRHPILRNISAMMALVNFFGVTVFAQAVFFAKTRFEATDPQVSLFFSAAGVGVVVLSLSAGYLRRHLAFGVVALGALMTSGLLTVALAFVPWFPVAVVLVAGMAGLGTLFNINTASLRQSIVPEQLLGRVLSVASVLAWSANPVGALLGGYAIERTGNVSLVYAVIGVVTFSIALFFFVASPLGHAERHLEGVPEAVS